VSATTARAPHQEFEIVFTTPMNVIEQTKEEHKRTAEKFQRSIVRGEQKPIKEKLQSPYIARGYEKWLLTRGLFKGNKKLSIQIAFYSRLISIKPVGKMILGQEL